ncbi:CHASE2 domain-containing protein [Solimonas aquatica]|uniref:CHASE2 domain-containing protein n=1 Tax=Solimonas aquatica TaxID=489703 RepID=A0A1H9L656_9GAMM|nr:CHASE2 domain-containing protein [Solimonas aquatica]SER06962.1 CHASE2 domain-containing protein [Solimonas aquatica]
MFRGVKNFFLAFVEEIIIHTLRGPFVFIALAPLIAATGAWHYLASSFAASDAQHTAAWSQDDVRLAKVVVVAIDDVGYQHFFQAQSPLNRERLSELLGTIREHSPKARRIVLDLDASPMPGQAQAQQALDALLLREPALWVLPAVNAGSEQDIAALRQWRAGLCQRGLSFGLPYVPNEFGYPSLTEQYEGSLADAALQAPGHCVEPASHYHKKAMLLSPIVLQSGLVLPFSGDLQMLGEVLSQLDAEWIVVGGAWGQTDVFGSPFGDRFGVQVHAAALAGGLAHEQEASHLVALIVVFGFISLCTAILNAMSDHIGRLFGRSTPQMVGHNFYITHLQPIFFVFLVLGLLMALSEGLAMLRARTGYWIPTSIVGCTTLAYLLLTWNWGQTRISSHGSFRHLWHGLVLEPIKHDLRSVGTALKVIRHGPIPGAWGLDPSQPPPGRAHAAVEGLLAAASLVAQTLVPPGTIIYGLLHAH